MTTSLFAAVVGGWEIILIALGLAWMAFWIWRYLKTSHDERD
jgi:hypothetical protein